MNPNMAYYALATKIATKKGRILRKNDWNSYMDCSSIEQLARLLNENVEFGKAFKEIDANKIGREDLETALLRFKTLQIENLLHYFSGPYKEFIETILMEADIKDLSLILRKLTKNESLDGIEERFIHSITYTNLSYEHLLSSGSVEQLIEKLKGTPYYNGLSNLSKEDAIKREFHIEMKLYVALYKSIFEKAEKLNKEDQRAVKELIGFKIDLLNIQWIYRAKKYYEITPEEMFIYSLEGGLSLGYNRLKKLCYSNLDEFVSLSKRYLKNDFFKDLNDTDINIILNSYLLDYLKKNTSNNIGTVISFIYLVNIVIDDLMSIIEGIKYKVPKEKLREYLVQKI